VPQGLAISNILASIYLTDFDNKHKDSSDYRYFRYVDDILVICNRKDINKIKDDIVNDIKKSYILNINKDKEEDGNLDNGFSYLGYLINKRMISVKRESVLKLENGIESIFSDYQHCKRKNEKFFIWSLNQKITGCIVDNKKYGWFFFYSQITDKQLLFHFDWLIKKLLKRYKIRGEPKLKSFVRTYHEIIKNLHETNYIPTYDEYSMDKKRSFLTEIMDLDIEDWDNEKVEVEFNRAIFRSVKELEKDLQNFS
jgi:RNA-directed DNA polymerase